MESDLRRLSCGLAIALGVILATMPAAGGVAAAPDDATSTQPHGPRVAPAWSTDAVIQEEPRRVPRRSRAPAGTRLRLAGPLTIEADERVEDAVAILGSVTVRGEVTGDVVAIGGSARLEDGASVGGDIVSIGGEIVIAPSARTSGRGTQVTVGFPEIRVIEDGASDVVVRLLPERQWVTRLLLSLSLVRWVALLLLVTAAALLAATTVEGLADRTAASPVGALLVGLALQFVLVPAVAAFALALAVSIVGLPLVPMVVVGAAVTWAVGFTAAAAWVGRAALGAIGWPRPSPAVAALVGTLPVAALTLASRLAWWWGAPVWGWPLLLALVAAAIEGLLWTIALGALALHALDRGPARAATPPAAQDPPPPLSAEL